MTTVEEDIKAWADKHLLDEQEEKKTNPFFDYVTIPVKEYRELVAEKAKLEQQVLEYYKQAELYKDLVAEYKHEMCQLLGINITPLQTNTFTTAQSRSYQNIHQTAPE